MIPMRNGKIPLYETCPLCKEEYALHIKEKEYAKITNHNARVVCCRCFSKMKFIQENPGLIEEDAKGIINKVLDRYRGRSLNVDNLHQIQTNINRVFSLKYKEYKVEIPLYHILKKFGYLRSKREEEYVNRCLRRGVVITYILKKDCKKCGVDLL